MGWEGRRTKVEPQSKVHSPNFQRPKSKAHSPQSKVQSRTHVGPPSNQHSKTNQTKRNLAEPTLQKQNPQINIFCDHEGISDHYATSDPTPMTVCSLYVFPRCHQSILAIRRCDLGIVSARQISKPLFLWLSRTRDYIIRIQALQTFWTFRLWALNF